MTAINRESLNVTVGLSPKILQIGGGNFIRGYINWMVEILNREAGFNAGTILIKPTNNGDYDLLNDQDGLYTVVLKGFENGEVVERIVLVKNIIDIINPYKDYEQFLDSAKIPTIRWIISNTTEVGIKVNENDLLTDKPSKEYPGKLTQWLFERFRFFHGDPKRACIFLPLELIEHNGEKLKKSILEYSKQWELGEDFRKWIEQSNIFCDSLVDRIISGYPETEALEEYFRKLGYLDRQIVIGELYHSLIISAPVEIHHEIPFFSTSLNVKFVEELKPYRELKVFLLNGAHTAITPVGILAGFNTVKEVMQVEILKKYLSNLLLNEISPCIRTLGTDEKGKYISQILERFANPGIDHFLKDIALNSIAKFEIRLLPSLKKYCVLKGDLPSGITLSLACLLYFYSPKNGTKETLTREGPEIISRLTMHWNKYYDGEMSLQQLVYLIFSDNAIFQNNLTLIPELVSKVSFYLDRIQLKGIIHILRNDQVYLS